MKPRFAADRMLGRLARMLRLLGYDTSYRSSISPAELAALARDENRIILTRGNFCGSRRFFRAPAGRPSPLLQPIYIVASDDPREQLRDVAERFSLDPRGGLFTRCTRCNGLLASVPKNDLRLTVPPKAFEAYDDFYRCADCGHVYWRGTHVDRILRNLSLILDRRLQFE